MNCNVENATQCIYLPFMAYDYALSPNKYLTKEEEYYLRGILAKFRDTDLRNTTMIMLMLVCGLRSQEVINLSRADFNLDDKSIFIKTIKRGRARIVPLPPDLIFRIKELLESSPEEHLFKMTRMQLCRIWADYRPCKKGTHCLRHTAAKNIYQKTKDFSLAQAFLGHKMISTTAVYLQIQVDADELRGAVS